MSLSIEELRRRLAVAETEVERLRQELHLAEYVDRIERADGRVNLRAAA